MGPLHQTNAPERTAQLMQILEALAVRSVARGGFSAAACQRSPESSVGTTILVVTPIDSPELINNAASLLPLGYQVLVFVVGRKVVHPQLLYRSSQETCSLSLSAELAGS